MQALDTLETITLKTRMKAFTKKIGLILYRSFIIFIPVTALIILSKIFYLIGVLPYLVPPELIRTIWYSIPAHVGNNTSASQGWKNPKM